MKETHLVAIKLYEVRASVPADICSYCGAPVHEWLRQEFVRSQK